MKPLRLELRGFTSFRETQVVDLADRRLFVITGPTGAGKTSLLDAMTWALFGRVPRVGTATRQLIHHGSNVMSVRFDFQARGETYRVSRQAPAATGTRLERQLVDGSWERIADRAQEVTAEVQSILGLSYDTFTKTVFLPQGQFDRFLRGEPKERREVLTSLLGLDIYGEMQASARNRASGLRAAVGYLDERLGRIAHADGAQIAEIESALRSLEGHAQALGRRRERLATVAEAARLAEAATAAYRTSEEAARRAEAAAERATEQLAAAERDRAEAEAQRRAAETELATLAYDEAAHRELERRFELAAQASRARAELEAAAKQERTLRTEAEGARARAAAAATEAAHAEAERERRETTLAAATAQLREAAGRAAAARDALASARERRGAARAEAERQAESARQRAQTCAALAAEIDRADRQRRDAGERAEAAARDAQAAAATATTATEAREAQAGALATAQRTLDAARTAYAAATLRRDLRPGDPCPVCGEAVGDLAHMETPDDLDRAERTVAEAEAALAAHRREAEAAQAQAAAAAATAQATATAAQAAQAQARAARDGLDAFGLPPEAERAALDAVARESAERERAETERAAALDREATAGDSAERELDRTLARVPVQALPDPADADTGPADPGTGPADPSPDAGDAGAGAPFDDPEVAIRSAEALAAALAEEGEQRAHTERARRTAEAAATAAREANAHADHRDAQVTSAEAQLQAARERARALGVDPDAVQSADAGTDADRGDAGGTEQRALDAALREARAQAQRAVELAQRMQTAASALAAATATVAARGDSAAAQQAALTAARAQAGSDASSRSAAERARDEAWALALGRDGEREAHPEAAPPFDPDAFGERMRRVEDEIPRIERELGATRERLDRAREEVREAQRIGAEIDGQRREAERFEAMSRELQANHFVAFVQREAMQVLAQDASVHLHRLSRERYRLSVQEDEFSVIDAYNGDERRSVKTLSGGETFLASLALALALSERLPELAGAGGAMSLEALFLDEGFGSLDAEALDVAMEGLELLADGQRVIGVISHVPQVAARLTDRIAVEQRGGTSIVAQAAQPLSV